MSELAGIDYREFDPGCGSIQELYEYVSRPAIETEAMIGISNWTAYRVAAMTKDPQDLQEYDHPEPQNRTVELQPESFVELYDPALPTVAIDAEMTFSGSELVGLAAQQQKTVNVVYLFGTSPGEAVADERGVTKLQLDKGMIIDAGGTVHWGDFPEPIVADVVDTADDELLEEYTAKGVSTINAAEVMHQCGDKDTLASMLHGSSTAVPARFTPDQLWANDASSEYVIKPSNRSQGLGVQMFAGSDEAASARKYYDYLQTHGYEPVIEERIRSYPLIDPQTGDRLDWNVRAIIANGQLIDMYVRASKWGGPVNKSLGAHTLPITDLHKYGVGAVTADILQQKLIQSSLVAAQRIPTAVAGLDVTITEDLEPAIFEVNIGNTGGLQTIAKLSPGHEKTVNGQRLLQSWLPCLVAEHAMSVGEVVSQTPIRPSFMAVLEAVEAAKETKALARLPVQQVIAAARTPFTAMLWARMAHNSLGFLDNAAKTVIEKTICQQYPLEAGRDATHFIPQSADPNIFMEHTQTLESVMPSSPDWSLLRAIMHSVSGDLGAVRHELLTARQSNATDEAIDNILSYTAASLLDRIIGDVEDEQSHKLLTDYLRTFCFEGFDAAAVCHAEMYDNFNEPALKTAADYLHFATALVDGRYAWAAQTVDALIDDDRIDILQLDELLRPYRHELLKDVDGARISLSVDLANQLALSSILQLGAAHAIDPERSPADTQSLVAQIVNGIDGISPADMQWATQALTEFAEACKDPSREWRLPYGGIPDSNIQLLLQALHAYVVNDRQTFVSTYNMLTTREDEYVDMELIAHAYSTRQNLQSLFQEIFGQ